MAFSLAVAHVVTRTFDRSYQAWQLGNYHWILKAKEMKICFADSKDVCVVEFAGWVDDISLDIYFNFFFWWLLRKCPGQISLK